jgi:hypothetical protein
MSRSGRRRSETEREENEGATQTRGG